MITFTLCLLALIAGYFIYGRFIERVFGPDDRKTPALTKADGVDYIPLPTWKIFMIQFLNIAGLGPIFGAIMGAKFGTASYLWIVLGSIFVGAVHDYLAGMLSLRHDGESLPEIIGRYLGLTTKQLMRGFTVILMILVGAVFVAGPAGLLAKLTPDSLDTTFWIIVVFAYYIFATLLPVDKIIGKIYPVFGICLGHQAIGEVFGGKIVRAAEIIHGKVSPIRHNGRGLYAGLPQDVEVGRYHSLIIDRATLPDCLEVTSELADGTIMGVRHKEMDIEGIQFHPESILTPAGRTMMQNFLDHLRK